MVKSWLKWWCAIALMCSTLSLNGQIYFTRDGEISFHSDAPLEKIESINKSVSSVINVETGQMEFAVLIKAFQFKKALMQQHFNENYMESDKYPKATFKGTFTGFKVSDLDRPDSIPIEISGMLTIHGKSKEIKAKGTMQAIEGKINGSASIDLAVSDFDIQIPAIVREKIAKIVQVKIEVSYQPMES